MVSILAIICIIATGYGISFHIAFGHAITDYRDFAESLFTLFLATLGDFDLDELRNYNQVLGVVLFVSFIVIMFFVVVSMFLAIVDAAYESVREALIEEGQTSLETDPLTRDIKRVLSAPLIFANAIYYVFVGGRDTAIGPTEEEIEMARAEEAKKAAQEEAKKLMSPEALERQAKLKLEHEFKKLYETSMGRVEKLKESQELLLVTLNKIMNNIGVQEEEKVPDNREEASAE